MGIITIVCPACHTVHPERIKSCQMAIIVREQKKREADLRKAFIMKKNKLSKSIRMNGRVIPINHALK